jgi:hypothetical protein
LDNTDATNVIIKEGSRVRIQYRSGSTDNNPRSVNSGAIIQKYYQGKTSTKTINTGGGKIYLEQFISRENLALWLTADKGVFLNESNIITSWKDQSPNSNDAIARTGNVTLANNSINSKPALRFTGNSNLITNSFLPLNYHTPITMFAVSKASSGVVRGNQATARYLTSVTNSGGYDYGLAYGSSGTQFANFSNTYGRSFVSNSDI